MSLLMDALKKAEQEKKEAAKRLKESEAENQQDSLENTLESELDKSGEHQPLMEAATRSETILTGNNPATTRLSLAPIDQQPDSIEEAQSVEYEEQPPPELENSSPNLSLEATHDEAVAEVDAHEEETEKPSQNIPVLESDAQEFDLLDQTFHGVDLKNEAPPLDEFDRTIEEEALPPEAPFHEETLPGVPAVQFAKDLGGEDQPTPVAAQTVFTATDKYNRGTSGFKWVLIVCGVAAVLAGSVWYYYTVTPMIIDSPSPMVAKGVEFTVPAQSISPPEEAVSGTLVGEPEISAAQDEDGTQKVAGSVVPEAEVNEMPEISAETSVAAQSQEEAVLPEEVASVPVPSPESNETTPAGGDAFPEDLPEEIELSPALIKISRSKGIDLKGQLINDAYAAYMAEDFSTAGEKYEEVLAKQPDNRDALLGIGAIATRSGDGLKALKVYSRLLRLNPKDELARALLINLQSDAEIIHSESAIKVMIQENPDLPFLYFTLGNIYASQLRWPEAQQAFFDAYRQDSSNPDYALNLAISLDKIGQFEPALDYYNTALKLSDDRVANFDPALVISRIETLSNSEKP